MLSVMLDITERKQTETQLLSAIESVMQDTSWFGQIGAAYDVNPHGPVRS